MIEILSGTWAAGETKTFHINGQRLEILDAQYALDVYLMDKSGAQMSIMKNSEASFFSQPKEGFNSLQIYSAQAQFIRFFVGSGDAGTRRISSTVQVVDGEKARSIAASAFSWRPTANSTNAANRAYAQLWNPAGSGVRAVIDGLMMTLSIAGPITIGRNTVDLATPGQPVRNLRTDSAVPPACLPRAIESGSVILTEVFGSVFVSANGQWEVSKRRPIVVMPGTGFVMSGEVAAVGTLSGMIQFFEEPL